MPSPSPLIRLTLAALILAAGVGLWASRQAALNRARHALAGALAERAAIEARLAAAQRTIESARGELAEQRSRRDAQIAAASRLRTELAGATPESQWEEPPPDWPRWESASPYVWLRKDLLTKLPLARFETDGGLSEDAAKVLDLASNRLGPLNASLQEIVAAFSAKRLAHVEKENGPPDSLNGDRTLTIKVPPLPQDGTGFAQQFEAALKDELGAERAELLIKANLDWIESQFNQGEASTSTCSYSLTLHTNGLFSLDSADGRGSSSSSGSQRSIQMSIPPYLIPSFGDLLQSPSSATSADPAQ
jgi:hypothetical protein